MAEVNAKDLTTKTAPASTDSMLLFGTTTNEGAKITVDNLANNILERLATKTFPNQVGGSSAATILAQLATLNSNLNNYKFAGTLDSSTNMDDIDTAGAYYIGSSPATNYPPIGGYVNMIVLNTKYGLTTQIIFGGRVGDGGSSDNTSTSTRIWIRYRNNGTWTIWRYAQLING